MASHAWAVLATAALATFLLLPYAHRLYNGANPLAGFLLHRLLLALFLLGAVMAGASLAAQLHPELTRPEGSVTVRLGNLAKILLVAAPALILASALALLMLNGYHVGMALG